MMKEILREICALLNKHEVDYLLIGGVAVVFHDILGVPLTLISGVFDPKKLSSASPFLVSMQNFCLSFPVTFLSGKPERKLKP